MILRKNWRNATLCMFVAKTARFRFGQNFCKTFSLFIAHTHTHKYTHTFQHIQQINTIFTVHTFAHIKPHLLAFKLLEMSFEFDINQ